MGFFGSVFSSALVPVILMHSICLAAPGPQKVENNVKMLWAFGAIRASSPHPKLEPVTTQIVLTSGDKLEMMIQVRKKCFVYLIHKDSQGDFTMLFPYSLKQFDTDYQTARTYYAPKGEAWFQLDRGPAVRPSILSPRTSACSISNIHTRSTPPQKSPGSRNSPDRYSHNSTRSQKSTWHHQREAKSWRATSPNREDSKGRPAQILRM